MERNTRDEQEITHNMKRISEHEMRFMERNTRDEQEITHNMKGQSGQVGHAREK
jgi:hypothetical protein